MNPITLDSDRPLTVCGVSGRLTHRTVKPGAAAVLFTHQKWVSELRPTGRAHEFIRAEIRYDDSCGNGHNSFAITCDILESRKGRMYDIGEGAAHEAIAAAFPELAHEAIAAAFPELAHLTQWHGTSDDGPSHYVANTVYLAGNRDSSGRRAGEPSAFDLAAYFDDSPIGHRLPAKFLEFCKNRMIPNDQGEYHVADTLAQFQVIAIKHDDRPGENYKFAPHYTFAGYADKWYECPFKDERAADEFCAAFNSCAVRFVKIPTMYSEGKARELDAARHVAVWPDATDDELTVSPEQSSLS